jgi:hypothetical protein
MFVCMFVVWNVSLLDLEAEGVYSENVCYGKPWTGFITKPTTYINYMKNHLDDNSYAILMDSDTMFSGVSSVAQLWNKYDCILKKSEPGNARRDVVMSTETSCWVGQYCKWSVEGSWMHACLWCAIALHLSV